MTIRDKIIEHWEVFKTIEDDLYVISKYIKFDQRNFSAYSVELSKVLIFTCSEIESIFKIFCDEVYKTKVNNIGGFKEKLLQYPEHLALIESFNVKVEKSIGDIIPWSNFSTQDLKWWRAYNKLKHEYTDNLIEGNLENVITSVTGLYCILICLQLVTKIEVSGKQAMVYPTPTLFKSDKVASGMGDMIAVITENIEI